MKQKFEEPPSPRDQVGGVYESAARIPAPEDSQIVPMLSNIIARLERIEEKIDETIYPPESAMKPAFIRRVKKARADIMTGRGTTYESMDAFIRAISE